MGSLVRLMKEEKKKLNESEKLIYYYRSDPVAAVRDLLDIQLVWFQRICLRNMWKKPFVTLVLGRGIGKSWLLAIFAVLRAMLYPGIKIGIIAPVYRQSLYVFDYIEELYNNSPYVRAATSKKPVVQPLRAIMKFHNNSFIEALPVGDGNKIRGRRYHIVLGDEWAQMDPDLIKKVIRPFLNIKIQGRQNQLIQASTSYYSWNHFYTQYLFFHLMMKQKPDKYWIGEYTFEDVLIIDNPPFEIDTEILAMSKADDPLGEIWEMENKCFFPTESKRFITPSMVDSCTPKKYEGVSIELKGDPKAFYVLGIDCARVEGGDDFALVVLKILESRAKLVKVISRNGATYQEMASIIRKAVYDFNVQWISMDSRGGGLTLKDLLAEKWTDPITNESYPPILDAEDEIYNSISGLHILHLVNFHGRLIENMFANLKSKIDHHRLLFPIDIRRSSDKQFEEIAHDIIKLKQEMYMIEPIVKGQHIGYQAPTGYKKDRVTALVLALKAWDDLGLLKVKDHSKKTSLATGFWITPAIKKDITGPNIIRG